MCLSAIPKLSFAGFRSLQVDSSYITIHAQLKQRLITCDAWTVDVEKIESKLHYWLYASFLSVPYVDYF